MTPPSAPPSMSATIKPTWTAKREKPKTRRIGHERPDARTGRSNSRLRRPTWQAMEGPAAHRLDERREPNLSRGMVLPATGPEPERAELATRHDAGTRHGNHRPR